MKIIWAFSSDNRTLYDSESCNCLLKRISIHCGMIQVYTGCIVGWYKFMQDALWDDISLYRMHYGMIQVYAGCIMGWYKFMQDALWDDKSLYRMHCGMIQSFWPFSSHNASWCVLQTVTLFRTIKMLLWSMIQQKQLLANSRPRIKQT